MLGNLLGIFLRSIWIKTKHVERTCIGFVGMVFTFGSNLRQIDNEDTVIFFRCLIELLTSLTTINSINKMGSNLPRLETRRFHKHEMLEEKKIISKNICLEIASMNPTS